MRTLAHKTCKHKIKCLCCDSCGSALCRFTKYRRCELCADYICPNCPYRGGLCIDCVEDDLLLENQDALWAKGAQMFKSVMLSLSS